MLVITLLHKPNATMADFHRTAIDLDVDVSQTAVEKRFAAGQPLVDFLREALERALKQTVASQPATAELLQPFTAVFVGDSTTIPLPDDLADLFPGCGGSENTSKAALKLQILWDIKSGRLERLVVETGRASDAGSPTAVHQAAPGTLLIYDLGYFSLARFAALDRQQAKFISRLQPGTTVLDTEGVDLDLVRYLRRQPTALVDIPILLGANERLRCRLIAVRVPEEVANRRRQQARKKARDHGREASAEYLELLGWSLFVTNCSAEELTWKAIVVLYRARWQIELLFKLWKSFNGLTRCRKGASPLEHLAVFYAKLLGVLLQHWLLLATAWLIPQRSLIRAAQRLGDEIKALLLAVDDSVKLEEALLRLQRLLQKLARVKSRKKNPSHAQLLNEPELLDWVA
jgi:Transposase DDE domain